MADATARAAASGYDRVAVDARNEGAPGWLRERRLEAWRVWEDTPLPTTALEEWRYTDPRQLGWDKVKPAPSGAPGGAAAGTALDAARAELAGRAASGTVLQAGPDIVEIALDDELRRKGVVLMDLAAAASSEHGDMVREHLATRAAPATAGKFAALNAALWSAGVYLYVPRGVRIEKPVRVLRWIGDPGLAYFPRTLVIADEGSHVALVEEFTSPDFDAPVFSCAAVEVYAAAAADIQYVGMQRWGKGVRHLSTQRTIAGRDANLDTLVVNLGGDVARVNLAARLEGAGARSDMLGLYFGERQQHFDHVTRQDHVVPHATSDLLYKGALDEKAEAVFRGLIKVYPNAQRTDAYQTNRNLLLSRRARATSLPNLEIEADDVRCSHAATVGHLDEEELFYIMSRGVPRKEAERLVVFGFFGEVLERLPLPGVVAELRSAIERKIG